MAGKSPPPPARPSSRPASATASTSPTSATRTGLRPDGNCRACVVEIEGERLLAPSCCRLPAAGMVVRTDSERARRAQKLVLELLLANAPQKSDTLSNELRRWCAALGVENPRFAPRLPPLPPITIRR